MKRNVMIYGEFTVTELTNTQSMEAANVQPNVVIKGKKASERLAILKAAGIDTSNLFAMGDEMVVRVVDGVPTQVFDDDPVFAMIKKGGHVPDRRLFRRWVMGQMFHLLRRMEPCSWRKERLTFVDVVQDLGYEYQWKMLEEELRVQAKLAKSDEENFQERNRWFNDKVVSEMMTDYIEKLQKYIDGLKVKHCKNVPYKTIKGTHYFCDDINAKVFYPLNRLRDKLNNFCDDADDLYEIVHKFNKKRVRLAFRTKQSKAFIDAYKGAGAFYTMKNLILFHGCQFRERGKFIGKERSMKLLEKHSTSLKGWELLGVMKELIKENGISIEKKIAEWRKK